MNIKKGATSSRNSQAKAQDTPSPDENWDERIEFLRGLAHIVKDEHLSELSVESGGMRMHLKGAVVGVALVAALPVGEGAPAPDKVETGAVPVVSPMVGVFYRAPSPGDPPFVEVGDTIHAGQVVGVVEAMKVFNEIISDIEGVVTEVVAEDAALVETGAALLMVKKS
jgi:acetyl-CoA carboxylase biotin carboxyl carrier protein